MRRIRHATRRLYATALLAFPRRHRAAYGAEMLESFERTLARRYRAGGLPGACGFIAAATVDAIRAGIGERRHLAQLPGRRAVERSAWFAGFGRDLVHPLRSLSAARMFALVCSLSLGVGMGGVLAIVVFIRGATGAPAGIRQDGLVELLVVADGPLRAEAGSALIDTWSYPDFEAVRSAETGLTVAGWAYTDTPFRPDQRSAAVRVPTAYVSASYFAVVGVTLARGRTFANDAADAPEVVISHDLWRNQLGEDPDVIGRQVSVDGMPHVVTGVTPAGFRRHLAAEESPGFELFRPLTQHPEITTHEARLDRRLDWLRVVGRLSPDASLASANAAVSSIMAGLADVFPATNEFRSASVEPYFPMGARLRDVTMLVRAALLALSGMVLGIVCLNVSGMVAVRTAARERELAVRLAIGASRRRLVRHLLAEAVVLAGTGATLGAGVLFGLPAIVARAMDAPLPDDLRPDLTMGTICVALTGLTSLAFGLMPAVRFSRPSIVGALKDDGGAGGRRVSRVHRLTAAVQVAFAVPFLVMAV